MGLTEEDIKNIYITPEQVARVKIDKMFEDAGWEVINRNEYESNKNALVVREGLLKNNMEADYLLMLNNQVVGVLEAKRKEIDISSEEVRQQAEKYICNIPSFYQTINNPIPLIYLSNGEDILFRDISKDEIYKKVHRIETPKEITKRLGIKDYYSALPVLKKDGLRQCQYDAVLNLEKSFIAKKNRALIVLATGAGKTFTACLLAYRMLTYTPMKRILFLVDRNNLGKQAEEAFATFALTEEGLQFNKVYEVQRVKSNDFNKNANITITTIQRLFSYLKGDNIEDSDNDDDRDININVVMPKHPKLEKNHFDMIIIDESHRSIYGNWQNVINHFETAKIVGLTATPIPETMAFFNENIVVNYTLEQSIKDNVNVDYRIYRIKTRATQDGGAILEGETTKQIIRYTGKVKPVDYKKQKDYDSRDLNRSIVNLAQIKLILQTFKEKVYSEMFAEQKRREDINFIPKTLIYALNDMHADTIVHIAREVFNVDNNNFVQKITYSSGDTDTLINSFRNDKDFRIAVTVNLVATGTDIKPLEVVMFMRDVQSEHTYIQMLGRGVRTVNNDVLRKVTPNAVTKDYFILVDCVGVTEHEKTTRSIEGREGTITLERLLELLCYGNVEDKYLSMLQRRIARINNRTEESKREVFFKLCHKTMAEISDTIYKALEENLLPKYIDINEPNTERKELIKCLTENVAARKYLLELNAGYVDILQPGEDVLIEAGFSFEEAKATTEAFEKYINEHKDEIEALKIIYNNSNTPLTKSMLEELQSILQGENIKFAYRSLWNMYKILDKTKSVKEIRKEELEYITNIIQLVRFAYHKINQMEGFSSFAKQRFNLWCGQKQNELSEKQKEVFRQIADYVIVNSYISLQDLKDMNEDLARNFIISYNNYDKASDVLVNFASFITNLKQSA